VLNLGARRRCPGMAGTKLANPVGSMIGLTREKDVAQSSQKGSKKIGNKRKRTTSLSSIEGRPSTRNRPDTTNKNDQRSELDSSDDEEFHKPNIVSFYFEFALSEKETDC
jgi:hypothetical protein